MKKLLNLDQSLLIIFSNGTILATFIMIFLTFGVLISESYLIWNHKKIDYIYINICPFSPHFKTHIQLFTYTFIQHCYCIHRALFLSHTYIHDTSWPVISQNYASVGEREGSPWAVTNCPSTCRECLLSMEPVYKICGTTGLQATPVCAVVSPSDSHGEELSYNIRIA